VKFLATCVVAAMTLAVVFSGAGTERTGRDARAVIAALVLCRLG